MIIIAAHIILKSKISLTTMNLLKARSGGENPAGMWPYKAEP